MAEPLRNRLVRAVVEALTETDPVVSVAVGENRLHVSWVVDKPEEVENEDG